MEKGGKGVPDQLVLVFVKEGLDSGDSYSLHRLENEMSV